MNFSDWEPVYEAILADMGYDREGDERARDHLATIVGDRAFAPEDDAFAGDTVAVVAPGPSLVDDLDAIGAADVVVAAGTAADRLRDAGRAVDWIVTDLDGHTDSVSTAAEDVVVAAHAHGDNRDLLDATVPGLDPGAVLPTTQAAPVGPVRNYGGFTDGDRAAFLADALGADRLTFPGWDLDDEAVDAEKARKLTWAARLLSWLERRRGDSFALLDGRRDDLDRSALPIDG